MNPTFVFVHGGPAYIDYLEPYFGTGFPSGFTTRFYTQARGAEVTIETLIDQLGEQVGSVNGPVVLVGHSWGGALATEYLRRTADPRVKGLVLLDSFVCVADITTDYRGELARRGIPEATLAQVFFTPREQAAIGDLMDRLDASFDAATFRRLYDTFVATYDNRPFLRTLELPVLNAFGAAELRIPPERLRAYADLNPRRIRNLEIPGAGHFPFVLPEHRQRLMEALVGFAREVAGG